MKIPTSILFGDIPKTPYSGSERVKWLGYDNEDVFRQSGNPSVRDVDYIFNSYGYRCEPFDSRGDLNILFLGCSVTFGLGIPFQATYPQVICNLIQDRLSLNVTNWNMALPGKSNDYVARMALTSVPRLLPDAAFVMFTAPSRREYFDIEGRCIDHFPGSGRRPNPDPIRKSIHKQLDALASPYEDTVNLYKNYKIVELCLNAAGIPWMYSFLCPTAEQPLLNVLDTSRALGVTITDEDRARDGQHFGVESNRKFAEEVVRHWGTELEYLIRDKMHSLNDDGHVPV